MSSVFQPITPEEVVQQLRALRDRIPDFTQLQASEAMSLGARNGVDPRAIQSAINAVGASEAARSALGTTAEEMRGEAELSARWGTVVEELEATLKGVRATIMIRRDRLALTALQAYNICRQLARKKEHAHLLPHVAAMRQRFATGRRRAKPVEPEQPKPELLAQSKQS